MPPCRRVAIPTIADVEILVGDQPIALLIEQPDEPPGDIAEADQSEVSAHR